MSGAGWRERPGGFPSQRLGQCRDLLYWPL